MTKQIQPLKTLHSRDQAPQECYYCVLHAEPGTKCAHYQKASKHYGIRYVTRKLYTQIVTINELYTMLPENSCLPWYKSL